ncbi:MAG TPA: putative baseplate assembly protein [Pyrinomonadaceae bacterium]|nr:putative baseplate assembly protein [Pyrinomonadaceae bacterium]
MKTLAPNLFQRRFQDLLEIGRARLPSLAPAWTDHNAHDPGITLMELLAWVAEAQLYSLSRMRRDERAAYAALLGLSPHGTQGAEGMIWPDRLDPNSPFSTSARTVVLSEDTVINSTDGGSPSFRPLHTLLWAPGRVTRLVSKDDKRRTTDHTGTNQRGGLPFFPFGERTGRGTVLVMTFECRDEAGLFGKPGRNPKGAYWPIGVLAAPPFGGAAEAETPAPSPDSPLMATLITDGGRKKLKVAFDTTQGFLTTGAVLLDLESVKGSPKKFSIELSSPNGFPRPPRVLRIEPNVIPIRQGQTIVEDQHEANGMPDWNFLIEQPALRFAGGTEPIKVEITEASGAAVWKRCDRMSDHGPDEKVYEFDATTGQLTFGNGVNGRIPPVNSHVRVTYSVSDGGEGRVARNRKWKVKGFQAPFGVNPDPIAGGIEASGFVDERREARQRSREDHALVSSSDIAEAAKALPLLEVARAWVPAPPNRTPRTGIVTLIAMRSRPGGDEPEQAPETAQWLDAVRRSLSPKIPLGSRLKVAAPHYVEFFINAVLEVNQGLKPSAVKEEIEKELKKRLALVDQGTGVPPRAPGVPVTRRDMAAWMRATDGVKRVIELKLRRANGQIVDKEIKAPRNGLPRCLFVRNSIEVKRPQAGRSR